MLSYFQPHDGDGYLIAGFQMVRSAGAVKSSVFDIICKTSSERKKRSEEAFLNEGFICWLARGTLTRKPHFLPMQSRLLRSRTSALQHLDFEQE